jgi:glutamine---fructose-6-phosphate transaminase (isomerizing)
MQPPRRLIEGPYLRDLLAQPEAVAETCRVLGAADAGVIPARFHGGDFDRMVLTGMGSSHHALQAAVPELAATGLPVVAVEAAELIHVQPGLLTDRTLLIVVSQSGESAEVHRLLDQIPAGCRVVGITNTPGSALARSAALALITAAGPETTVACKTYLASVVTLLWFTAVLRGARPGPAAAELTAGAKAIAQYLSSWRDHVEQLAELLSTVRQLYLTGRGTSLAAAGQGALTLKEAARFPAEAMSCAAFRHGPLEILGPATAVVVLEGPANLAALNLRFLEDLRAQGGRVLHLGRNSTRASLQLPPAPDRLLPLLEILPLQLTSVALATLVGREAGRFRLATKITRAD